MSFFSGLRARLRALLRRDATEREMDDEISFHLERQIEANVRAGMEPAEARRRAQLAFGGTEKVREEHRDARGNGWLLDAIADARYGFRALRRNPVLATTAILTLALGIGANTAIFSVVNAVLLRPLPFPAPDRLMKLSEDNAEKGWVRNSAAPANYFDWAERVSAFQHTAAYTPGGHTTLTGVGPAVMLHDANVTGNFFTVLGVPAMMGRVFRDQETWQSGTHVAVISERLWRTRFGGRPDVVGRTVRFDDVPTEIVGVMPRGFQFPAADVDVWTPFEWLPAYRSQTWFRRAHWLGVVARLKPGVTIQAADVEFQKVVRQLQIEFPETNRVMGADLMPLHDFLIGNVRQPLLVLLGAVVLLLLIACANVGNLLLVQALGRDRDAALRLALGAARGRLARQALTESLVLSFFGGAAGGALGWAGTRALAALQPGGMLPVRDVGVDGTVLAYVLAASTASGLLFGIAPALWRSRRAPADALKEGNRGGEARRLRKWGNGLVVAEVSLALLLTVGAGLLVRSFWRLQHVDPGFDPHNVLSVGIDLPTAKYDSAAKVIGFFHEFATRVGALPGVEKAAGVTLPPLTGGGWTSDYHVEGRPADQYGTEVMHRVASPGYFQLMRVPVIAGRVFTDRDRAGSIPVTVINEALAREAFPGEDPLGKRIAFARVPDSTVTWWTVVGVVGNEHQRSLAVPPQIEAFMPFAQQANSFMTVVARTTSEPAALEAAVRRVLADLDPQLAVATMNTMDDLRTRSVASQRFVMLLLFTFGGVGLALAVVGVYGVIAQLSRRRSREMGIRLALGAKSGQVEWLVVLEGLKLTAFGLLLGLAVALVATRLMRSLLFEVTTTDPLTFLAVTGLLAISAASAAWIPAARAGRTDPAQTLRSD
jgi:putative ABC transport system permease protein